MNMKLSLSLIAITSALFKELQSFEDQNLIVMITNDEGETFNSVKLVSKGFVANKDDPDKYKKVYCALHF